MVIVDSKWAFSGRSHVTHWGYRSLLWPSLLHKILTESNTSTPTLVTSTYL